VDKYVVIFNIYTILLHITIFNINK
jgi:hypothetical protein